MKVKLTVPLAQQIKRYLLAQPELRDSDEKLAVIVWKYYHPELKSANMSFLMFAFRFGRGDYISFETIRRTRQKIQEEFPATRGLLYEKRRKNIEEVKEALSAPEMKAGGTP